MLDDADYQAFPYIFGAIPGYHDDMTDPIRRAARATLRDRVGVPTKLLEVGVWEGRSACWMLDNILTHPDSRYIGVDAWVSPPEVPVTARQHLAYHGAKATLITGDSRVEVPDFPPTFHAAIVDGLHTYEGCRIDLANCWGKLLSGGIMIVDDYSYPGLFGVKRAVDEWMAETGVDFAYRDAAATAVAFKK